MAGRLRLFGVADGGEQLAGRLESDRDGDGVAVGVVVVAGVADAWQNSQQHSF